MKVIGLGAGGHAKVILDILRLTGGWEIIGLLDTDSRLWGSQAGGIGILGGDELMPELRTSGVEHAFVGLGSVGDAGPRVRLYEEILAAGFSPVTAVHPTAVVARSSRLGKGVIIAAAAVVNPEADLGDNVIINTGAVVEHDCRIGDHAHIATGAVLCGGVQVGPMAHVGAGAAVRQGIRIGAGALVGAGAVVIRDVPDGLTVAGTPAMPLNGKAEFAFKAAEASL